MLASTPLVEGVLHSVGSDTKNNSHKTEALESCIILPTLLLQDLRSNYFGSEASKLAVA